MSHTNKRYRSEEISPYVVRIPRILVNPVELVNPWEIMKLLETMNPVKLLSLLPTVTLLRDCCDIALFVLSKNRKGWVRISNWAVFDTLHQIAQWKYKNALFDHYSVFSSRIWTYSKLAICWPFGLTQRTGSGGVVGGGGGGRRWPARTGRVLPMPHLQLNIYIKKTRPRLLPS